MKIAYFISSHGFGHAARSAAIMEQLRLKRPDLVLEIYGGTPEWFFHDSHLTNYHFHPGAVDVGLVQKSPMVHDLDASVTSIRSYLWELPRRSEELARELRSYAVDAVICDISPLGIAAAKKADLPCFLFENFTWEWIYEPYEREHPDFKEINARYRELFALPDFRMQSEPLCKIISEADCIIPPASRMVHESASECRARLGVPSDHRMGLVSMGGIPEDLEFALNHELPNGVTLVLSGSFERFERRGNRILLPHHSQFYHPDLVNAADFLIGKAGYSTIGEVCNSGTAYGCISRDNLRESMITSAFLAKRPNTMEISPERSNAFTLTEEIETLINMGKIAPQAQNGAELAAEFILNKLS